MGIMVKTDDNEWASKYTNVDEMEVEARARLPRHTLGYYVSGADAQRTLADNTDAFASSYQLRPRILRDVSSIDLSTTLLGTPVSVPIGAAPTAMQCLAHAGGEAASSRASARAGACFTLSTWSTTSLEDVSKSGGLRWFQLYIYSDRELTQELVTRAERAGYKAIVLTVDTPVLGKRRADKHNRFTLDSHLSLANFSSETAAAAAAHSGDLAQYVSGLVDPSLTWEAIDWIRSVTTLPIVVKGVLCPEDARLACDKQVAAVWVSNHGARQLDDVSATIDALEAVVQAVDGRCEVYMDGGVRHGSDVFKALALGARAVFVGRPVLWGLACGGERGVTHVYDTLVDELTRTMRLTGCTSVGEINGSYVSCKHRQARL